MAQQSPPLMDTAQLAARYATAGDQFAADQFDQFEFTPEGNFIYSMVGDEYAYEVAGVDTPNPTITIVSSPRSGTRRVPVAPGTGFYSKITEQLGAALQNKMAAEGVPATPEPPRDEFPPGSIHEGIEIRRNQRLNEAPFKVAEHFGPADVEMPRTMPPTVREAIATEEAALGERLGEIDEMQMSDIEGGMPQSYRSEQEVAAREQSGLDTLRQILRRAVRPAERKVRREERRGGK